MTQTFETYRPQLFYTAYRMLGSAMEAEDMVQETYLRFVQANTDTIENPKAYLTTIITRLCLDHLKSAKTQREQYIGPWLPEPLMTENLPAQSVAQKETLTMAFLMLLESLTPVERAVFLLREVFAYDYAEIAQIVNKSEANCRQLYSRAKKHLVANRPQFEPSTAVQQQVITDFMTALNNGDTPQMLSLLAPDVAWWSDGGGKVTAARRPLFGQENVMRFAQGIFRQRPDNMKVELVETNGTPSLLIRFDEQIFGIMNFTIANGQIREVHAVLNPDKLQHLR
jgi:RNA polymerase sigma-70 factor (ECF subfamily)